MQHPTGDSFSAKAGSCRAQPTASLKRPKLKIIITQTYLFKDLSNLLTVACLAVAMTILSWPFRNVLLPKAKARIAV